MNRLMARKPNYFSKSVYGGIFASSTTGVNATAIVDTGIAINQLAVEVGRKFEGVKLDLPVSFVADSGASITYSLSLRDSTASGGTFVAFATGNVTISNSTTATGATVRGVASISASLIGAKQWIRARCSRLGSAHDTGGDQLASSFDVIFFGADRNPATAS